MCTSRWFSICLNSKNENFQCLDFKICFYVSIFEYNWDLRVFSNCSFSLCVFYYPVSMIILTSVCSLLTFWCLFDRKLIQNCSNSFQFRKIGLFNYFVPALLFCRTIPASRQNNQFGSQSLRQRMISYERESSFYYDFWWCFHFINIEHLGYCADTIVIVRMFYRVCILFYFTILPF